MTCNEVLTSLVVVANEIDDLEFGEIKNRWSENDTCRISRTLGPLRNRTPTLWPFVRISIKLLKGVITFPKMFNVGPEEEI